MLELYARANILLLSTMGQVSSEIMNTLQEDGFSFCRCVRSIEDVRQVLIEDTIDLLIIHSPLDEGDVYSFSLQLLQSRAFHFSIIMLLDQNRSLPDTDSVDRMMQLGVIFLNRPFDLCLLLQVIKLILSFQEKILRLEYKASRLEKNLQENQLINRAKLLLIKHRDISEEEAHHYIEKKAMDSCVKKTAIAKKIIAVYAAP